MPTTFEHTKTLPTTFDKNPYNNNNNNNNTYIRHSVQYPEWSYKSLSGGADVSGGHYHCALSGASAVGFEPRPMAS